MSDPLIPPILGAVEEGLPARIEAARSNILTAIADGNLALDGNLDALAADLDALATSVSTLRSLLNTTWAAKLDALRTGLTDARMGYLDRPISQAGVKSVQRGVVTFAHGATSGTVTVAEVVTGKSLLLVSHSGNTPNTTTADYVVKSSLVRGELTNSTTLTFSRVGSDGAVAIAWQLLEFN